MPRSSGKKKTVKISKEADEAPAPESSAADSGFFGRGRKALDFTNISENARYRPPAEWIADVLKAHNVRRGMHWAPPLVWNDECFEYAKRQADECITARDAAHGRVDGMGGRMGQCILGPPHGPWRMNRPGMAESIVAQWYSEGDAYNYERPGFRNDTSNFMQVVWTNTTSVGMALSRDGRYAVANYFPAGHDVLLEPPQNKAVRNYFPAATFPSGFPSGPLEDKLEKERRYFRANVKPVQEERAPWLGPLEEPATAESEEIKRSRSFDSKKKLKRGNSRGKKGLPPIRKSQSAANLTGTGPSAAAVEAAAMAKAVASPKDAARMKKSKTAML